MSLPHQEWKKSRNVYKISQLTFNNETSADSFNGLTTLALVQKRQDQMSFAYHWQILNKFGIFCAINIIRRSKPYFYYAVIIRQKYIVNFHSYIHYLDIFFFLSSSQPTKNQCILTAFQRVLKSRLALQSILSICFFIFFIYLELILIMLKQKEKGEDPTNNQREEYVKVNAYTQEASTEQILTIALFLVEVAMHNIFVTSAIAQQDSSILWIMLAVTYVLLAVIIGDYFYLTCSDPVDDLVRGIDKGYKRSQTKHCKEGCDTLVHKSSYHCHSCDRCVEKFDHHCKYLNNCIGGKNYHSFFRLLVMVTAFCVVIIGSAIWIFVFAQEDASFNSKILSQWGVLATLIYTIVMMISVDTLLCFHLYLVLKLKKSTIDYLDLRTHDYANSSKEVIDG